MNQDKQPTMQDLLDQTRQVHMRLEAARAELEEAEVTASAGGGQVTVTMTAAGAVRQVT
jgi:DNA-binding protein YbaB